MRRAISLLAFLCLAAPAYGCDCEPHARAGLVLNGHLDLSGFTGGVGSYDDDYDGGGEAEAAQCTRRCGQAHLAWHRPSRLRMRRAFRMAIPAWVMAAAGAGRMAAADITRTGRAPPVYVS